MKAVFRVFFHDFIFTFSTYKTSLA